MRRHLRPRRDARKDVFLGRRYAPGYHVNCAPTVMTPELEPYRIDPEPNTPQRVFAGADTVFLRFTDEAEARGALASYWQEGVS